MLPLLAVPPVQAATPAAAPDLAGILTCKKTAADWTAFATAYSDPANPKAWGWRPAKVGTGMLQVFELRKPIVVFGEKTSKIAFSGSGAVALLKGKSLERLASELQLEPVHRGGTTQIFGKQVASTTETEGDTTITTKISLSASRSAEYPGFVLAGCSYSVDVQ